MSDVRVTVATMARTTRTGRGHEIREVIPTTCPNGHHMRPGNVLIGGDVEWRLVTCGTCNTTIRSKHGSDQWTVD